MITITIPSTGRRQRLIECIQSIDYQNVHICIWARKPDDTPYDPNDLPANISLFYSEHPVIYIQNCLALNSPAGSHILPIADDIVFKPGAIAEALGALDDIYPDSDGVVGLNASNMSPKDRSPYAFMLVGNRFFIYRLKRLLFYQGYRHFYADTELGEFAAKLDRFYFCPEAEVTHFHPSTGIEPDQTHLKNRRMKWEHDFKLYNLRKRHASLPV